MKAYPIVMFYQGWVRVDMQRISPEALHILDETAEFDNWCMNSAEVDNGVEYVCTKEMGHEEHCGLGIERPFGG